MRNKRVKIPPPPTFNLPTAEENLNRALKIARQAFRSDEAYRAAVEADKEIEWHAVRNAQARLVDWSIDAYQRIEEHARCGKR